MALYGTDQSKWQSNSVTEGDFIIVKATEGTGYVDPTCDAKYQLNKNAGKLLGFYHFARPDLGTSAVAEARFFYNNTKNYFREAIPVLDWEKSVSNVVWAKAFLDEVYRLSGVRPWIYMSASVVNGYNWSSVSNDYGLWIAGYPAKYNVKNPPRPSAGELPYKIGAWKFAAAWQYTSSAGTLDRNIFYGDAIAWRRYAGVVSTPAPKPAEQPKKEEPKKEDPKKEPIFDVTVPAEPEEKVSSKEEPKRGGADAALSQSTDRGLTIKEYNEVMKKAQQTVELADEAIKKFGIKFTMSNKVYDVLKTIAIAVLPFISFIYLGLANIWGFGFGEQVDATIQLIITAINVVLGAAVLKSSSDYKKK